MSQSIPVVSEPVARSRPREDTPPDATPRVRFVDQATREESTADEAALLVKVERIGSAARGRLAEIIDDAIERELAARGATSPGIGSTSDADAALSDQLFRARQIGIDSLALLLGPLRAATTSMGTLEATDTAALVFWARASKDRPVALTLDESDRDLGAHVTTTPLCRVLHDRLSRSTSTPTPNSTPTSTSTSNATAAPHLAGASMAAPDDAWRTWTLALTAARGPQPLSAFERLFSQSYVPLCNAIALGLDDPRARHAHAEFRTNFARVYTEACPAFAVTGKRPRMVLDAPEVAARIGRLHGARTTQLLMVDGMRFDLGAMMKEKLTLALASRASLTDELLLWSALPTNTPRQLETLARGAEVLREAPASDREAEPMRGRTVETIRRVKIGSRDVYKLDLAEARLREAQGHALGALPGIADALVEVIARHACTLPARTLLFVFGDHGFRIDGGVARHGEASPEEVLVPAYAMLVGEVH